MEKETPRLCAGGCGFFGSAETRNLCSKCYSDHLRENNVRSLLVQDPLCAPAVPPTNPFPCFIALAAAGVADTAITEENSKSTKKSRCESCGKKVGVVGFGCRCGGTFCGFHRYPEAHACNFDYKTAGRAALAKQHPLCQADKLMNRV